MIKLFANQLAEGQFAAFRTTLAFISQRLNQRETIEWALSLSEKEVAQRAAVVAALNSTSGERLAKLWSSAWRIIEEAWSAGPLPPDNSGEWYEFGRRIANGDRSGALIDGIVDHVKPRVVVESHRNAITFRDEPRGNPKTITDLFSISLSSGYGHDVDKLRLPEVVEVQFLDELGNALNAAVLRGLAIARRLGWSSEGHLWRLGDLKRVYFISQPESTEHEPDQFNRGIAPATKLLHSVVSRISELSPALARAYIVRFRATPSPVHIRLWAAFAKNELFVQAPDVSDFLANASEREFWDLHAYPEIAELRATRYESLTDADRGLVQIRISRLPPKKMWPKDVEAADLLEYRKYWAARELRRIQIAGGVIQDQAFDDLQLSEKSLLLLGEMKHIDDDFLRTLKAQWVAPDPDGKFDALQGLNRLELLNASLLVRGTWGNDPAQRASDWLQVPEHSEAILQDLLEVKDVSRFVKVVERLGWFHLPKSDAAPRSEEKLARKILRVIEGASSGNISAEIEGLTQWFGAWSRHLTCDSQFAKVWLRLSKAAIEKTNADQPISEEPSLNVVVQSVQGEPRDLDTLNTAFGKLVGAFLAVCPDLATVALPFGQPILRRIRNAVVSATGRSGLIGRYRLTEHLGYFLRADEKWATDCLIDPLRVSTRESFILWRAAARQARHHNVMRLLGAEMLDIAVDLNVARETREVLVFGLVIELLHSLNEHREPVIAIVGAQQMLRRLEDEVRAHAANAVQRFASDVPSGAVTREVLYEAAVRPFLVDVWPQERSLATPGVARAFADLPAACGEKFAAAVGIVLRFIVPFDCWSLLEFGLYGDEEGGRKLLKIDTTEKAEALLLLLNASIGTSETDVVPYDLADALDQIRIVSGALSKKQSFRRLITLVRR